MSEFSDLFGEWLNHTVTLRPKAGHGAEGVVQGSDVPLEGVMVERKRRLIRTSDGRESISETTIYLPAEVTSPISDGDQIVIDGDPPATVQKVAQMDVYGLFDHRVVNL